MKPKVMVVLGAAQFLMVLDQAVMNVSISQLVEDFDTDVTSIQAAITFYSLVMAALMITGGKLGDLWGRRRAFGIGMVIYAAGSALTAVSWSVPVLILGWSVLEGIGAALVLPAMAALIAGNFQGRSRALAYGIIGGVSGVGIAVGPILGGYLTTYLTWRLVFIGEVVIAIFILVMLRAVEDAPTEGDPPELDWVGSVLCASGLGLAVYGVLMSSTWGWVTPRNSPVEPFGFSVTLFVIAAGGVLLAIFVWWQRRREAAGRDPLVRLELFEIPPLRSGLSMLLFQNLILLGIFFVIPLYLQVVLGYDAFETGLRMLPVSVTLLVTSMAGPALARALGPRRVVRVGLAVVLVGVGLMLALIEPELDSADFAVAMGVLGVGMGLILSQLGNVVQSSVTADERGEAGGLQYTAQQLGAAVGTALMGAVVIGALASSFASRVESNPAISAEVSDQVGVELESGVSFVPGSQVEQAAIDAGLNPDEVAALTSDYSDAQLAALKGGLLIGGLVVLVAFPFTGRLPKEAMSGEDDEEDETAPATA